MICFCHFCQKQLFFVLVVAHNDPFFVQIGPKKHFLRGFPIFFRTNGLQHKLLILIESPSIFHWKSAKKSKLGVVFEAKFGPNYVQCCEKTKKLFQIFAFSGYRNTWVEIEDQNSKKYHIWRKLGLNFCLPFWVKNSKKWLFLMFLL